MAQYFADFSTGLPSYSNLNAVIALSTLRFTSGTTVIVPGQGFFTWFLNENDVPSNLQGNFVYPTTYGYGWIQDFSGFLVGDNGVVDLSNLNFHGFGWIGPKATKTVTGITPSQVQVISFPGVVPTDLVYLSFTSAPQGVPILPFALVVSDDLITITWQGTPTGNLNFNIVVFSSDYTQ